MITVYEQIDGKPWQMPVGFRTFRQAVDAVCGDLTIDKVGQYGYTFYQDNQCIGVI